jgi:hypothetical protein
MNTGPFFKSGPVSRQVALYLAQFGQKADISRSGCILLLSAALSRVQQQLTATKIRTTR